MKVRRVPQGDMIVLVDRAPVNGHRLPSTFLFHSVAKEFGNEGAAVLMTGMGDDGADGMRAVHTAGGVTIAQKYGYLRRGQRMPRAAIERALRPDRSARRDSQRFYRLCPRTTALGPTPMRQIWKHPRSSTMNRHGGGENHGV